MDSKISTLSSSVYSVTDVTCDMMRTRESWGRTEKDWIRSRVYLAGVRETT